MKKGLMIIAAALASALVAVSCAPKPAGDTPPVPPTTFTSASEYGVWANESGYELGLLKPPGTSGINTYFFTTPPSLPAYDSGRIVIGDSRCCQLGIYQQRAERSDFAAFAVWGGHYYEGSRPAIMNDELIAAVESCFLNQIEKRGECRIYFFATVNDYDHTGVKNGEYIAAAVRAAERFASMEHEIGGKLYRPVVSVIGIDGCKNDPYTLGSIFPTGFNSYVSEYNSILKRAVEKSPILRESIHLYSTVPDITNNNTGFINDALHYSDDTLNRICEFILDK